MRLLPRALAVLMWLGIALGARTPPANALPGDGESRAASPIAPDARTLYAQRCAVCHGPDGRGDGPAAGLLSPRPRDFTSGLYTIRSTPSGSLPTIDDVATSIARGLAGTSMPAFGDLLSREAIDDLARLVLAWAPAGARRAESLLLGEAPARDADAEARGAAVYARVGCGACHGADGRATGWRPPHEGPGAPPRPADLSEPWAFRGGADPEDVARRVLTGLDGAGMPGYAGIVTAREAWEVAYHVASLARRPIWDERDPARVRAAGVASDPLERGRYLANAMLCPLCHTPISAETGAYDTSRFLAGGMRVSAYPWGVWYSRNLTPDADTGLGRWSDDEIVRAVTQGIARDGRRLDPMAMPWPWFSQLTREDARAIATYLRSLPPKENPVPPASRVGFAEAAGGKLLALLGAEASVGFWGGNAASDAALLQMPLAPRGRRITATAIGWAWLAAGVALVTLGWRARARRRAAPTAGPRAARRASPWTWWVAGLALIVCWISLAAWPPLWLMSPEATVAWLFRGTPEPVTADLSPAARALVARGRYVATIAPCGLCHTPARAFVGFDTPRTLAGGMRARWRVYGAAVSSNLTRGAIAGASDAALLRAMASGIGTDGRGMHWQAMPWDIGSRWSIEDRRALVAYLRALPTVPGVAPAPRGPAAGDPSADTFDFGDTIRR